MILVYQNCELVMNTWGQASDQLQGTTLEKLAEIAGRICYDSFGAGRCSFDWHVHIKEVGHLSVYEHCYMEVDGPAPLELGKPGIYWKDGVVTFNLRAALENKMYLGAVGSLCPMVAKIWGITDKTDARLSPNWTTYLIKCSRACSHELVRHGDNTAISQRSTRYVDEQDSSHYCPFPEVEEIFERVRNYCNKAYTEVLNIKPTTPELAAYIDQLGRKARRSLARYVLPHTLMTEIIFSASREQWQHIKAMRTSLAADYEIRELCKKIRD